MVDDRGTFLRSMTSRVMFIARLSTAAHRTLFTEWTSHGPSVPGVSGLQFVACAVVAARASPCVLIR